MITQERLKELLRYDPETGIFTRLETTRWYKAVDRAGHLAATDGYERISIGGVKYLAHRLAWFYMKGEWPDHLIDHKNRNPSDNCFTNIRPATYSQNNSNRVARCELKGVWWDKSRGKWQAKLKLNKKTIHLGRFGCPTAAHFAYCKWAKVHHGEFARAR